MTEKKGLDKEGVQQIKQLGLDALTLLTHVNYELNMQRRQLMKPNIGRLCLFVLPDYLFGDDLQKQLKDIGDVNKIGAKQQGLFFSQPTFKKLQRADLPTLEAQRASQEQTKQQASVTVAQASATEKSLRQSFTIHPRKQYHSNTGDPLLANPVLVSTSPAVAQISPIGNQYAKINPHTSIPPRGSPSIVPQTSTSWLPCVRAFLVPQGVEGEPLNIIPDSWRTGTRKQYQTYVTAWLKFCKDTSIRYTYPTLQQVLDFLTHQSKTVGYSAVATARGALSSFITLDGIKVGEHPLVSRFMSGLFNQKPALPRYTEIWNPQIVLNYLKTFPAVDSMSLKQLALKLLMLMAHLSAQRTQTTETLTGGNVHITWIIYILHITSVETNQC
ncbi:uncharacterized protein [Montipora foliosa]|uniref:uncharacterized protein n=1 Tax=Montipora foliosa TaxID=591990 RepID=UPI0035F15530